MNGLLRLLDRRRFASLVLMMFPGVYLSYNNQSRTRVKECAALGPSYDGSEDVSILRNGLVLFSIGLRMKDPGRSTTQGSILAVNTATDPPTYSNITIEKGRNECDDVFETFRPHGIYVSNSTTTNDEDDDEGIARLFVVSHENSVGESGEESIFVFDIVLSDDDVSSSHSSSSWPVLRFRYKLVSNAFPNRWFLNDLVVLPSRNELFVTQFLPEEGSDETFLHRCVWSDDVASAVVVEAVCDRAHPRSSRTYNGITMSPDGNRIWVNALREGRLVAFDVHRDNDERSPASTTTTLTLREDASVSALFPVTSMDNVELDHATGDLTATDTLLGTVWRIPCTNKQTYEHGGRFSFRAMLIDTVWSPLPLFHSSPSSAISDNGITLVGFHSRSPIYYCKREPDRYWWLPFQF